MLLEHDPLASHSIYHVSTHRLLCFSCVLSQLLSIYFVSNRKLSLRDSCVVDVRRARSSGFPFDLSCVLSPLIALAVLALVTSVDFFFNAERFSKPSSSQTML